MRILVCLMAVAAWAQPPQASQQQPAPPVKSPEVQADRSCDVPVARTECEGSHADA